MEQEATPRTPKRPRKPPARMVRDFTVAEKQQAVTAMLTANRDHPLSARSIAAAHQSIGVPVHHETLRTWLKEYRAIVEATLTTKPATQVILDQQADTLSEMTTAKKLAYKQITNEAKAEAATYRDAAVVWGIIDDHMKAAMGISAEVVHAWQAYQATCTLLQMDSMQAFLDFHGWLKSQLPTLASLARETQQAEADNAVDTPTGDSDA